MKIVIKKITNGEGSIGSLINDNSLANNLATTISNFKAASVRTEKLIANLEDFTNHLNKQGTSINQLISDTSIYYSLKPNPIICSGLNPLATCLTCCSIPAGGILYSIISMHLMYH